MNAFIKSQFSYCPLTWMFHGRILENKINRIHERCLRIVYCDPDSSFEELLEQDCGITFHQRCLQILAIELFKIKLDEKVSVLEEVFPRNESKINTRNKTYFKSRFIKTELNGKDSLSFLGPKIWELIPMTLKDLTTIEAFKQKIKHWTPSACPCRNCRPFIKGVGFI